VDNLKPHATGSVHSFAEQELQALEILFADRGLEKLRTQAPDHPAVTRYDFVKAYSDDAPTLQYPDEYQTVVKLGSILLDRLALDARPLNQDFWTSIADQSSQKEIRARLLDPTQFEVQLSVLNCWSLLRSRGFNAELLEVMGFPDLLVNRGLPTETWLEVKHIQPSTNPPHVRRVIVKANRQIKKATSEGVGIVFLYLERSKQRAVLDDAVPADVQLYLSQVEREIASGSSRSVAQVIVAWDDYMMIGDPPQPTAYFFRRVTRVLEHPNPRKTPTFPLEALQLGRTLVTSVNWRRSTSTGLPKLQPITAEGTTKEKRIVVTQLFRQESELIDHIRAVHAVTALRNADGLERFDLSDEASNLSVILAAHHVTLGRHPYTLLVLGTENDSEIIEIALGFRIYDAETEKSALWLRPLDAFLHLLKSYGAPIRIGNLTELWIPKTRIELPADGKFVEVQLQPNEPFILNAISKVNNTKPKTVDVAWAFAIRSHEYRRNLRRYQK
jgi:hypothetical protein